MVGTSEALVSPSWKAVPNAPRVVDEVMKEPTYQSNSPYGEFPPERLYAFVQLVLEWLATFSDFPILGRALCLT